MSQLLRVWEELGIEEDYGAGIVSVHHFVVEGVHDAPQRRSQLRKRGVRNKRTMLDRIDSDALLWQWLDILISLLSRNLKGPCTFQQWE